MIVVRILGGRRAWEDGIDAVTATGKPVVLLSGEQQPDPDLMAASTVPAGVAAQAHNYFAAGGVGNLVNAHNFLSDTVLLTGLGSRTRCHPMWGVLERQSADLPGDAPTIAVLYYRAQHLAGNTRYVDALCAAIEAAGARPLPVFCSSLRTAPDELIELLGTADALIATVLAAGGTTPRRRRRRAGRTRHGTSNGSPPRHPHPAGLAVTGSREQWEANDDGLSPLDVASQVAVPEFDGRIITVPFSFRSSTTTACPGTSPTRSALRPCRRDRGPPRPAAAPGQYGQADRAGPLGLSDQARAHRQCRRLGHAQVAAAPADGPSAPTATTSATRPDPRPTRR